MTKFFEDFEPIRSEAQRRSDGSTPRRGNFDEYSPTAPQHNSSGVRAMQEPWYTRAARTADDAVRAGLDTMTFGLFDRALSATGAEPNAVARTQQARRNSPYATIAGDVAGSIPGGALAARGLAAAAPRVFAGAGIPQMMATGAAVGAGMTGADEAIRGRADEYTPLRMLLSGALGGATSGAIGGAMRYINPQSRVRGYGAGMSDAERAAAQNVADDAASRGVRLSVPEAMEAANPGTLPSSRVLARFNDARNSRAGSEVVHAFESGRARELQGVREGLAASLGPGAQPGVAAAEATRVMQETGQRANAIAEPFYQSANRTTLNLTPRALEQAGASHAERAAIREATRAVRRSGTERGRLADTLGVQPAAVRMNSVAAADAAKINLDETVSGLLRNERTRSAVPYIQGAERLRTIADAAAPDYAIGRNISGLGQRTVERMQQGPLGRIADSPGNTQAQAAALFGVTNPVEAQAARRAAARMDPEIARGILSNRISTGVQTSHDPLPTAASRNVARSILGPGFESVEQTLDALGRVRPGVREPNPIDTAGGVGTRIWHAVRDYGRGPVAEMLTDPRNIGILGLRGATEDAAAISGGLVAPPIVDNLATDRRRRKRRREGD